MQIDHESYSITDRIEKLSFRELWQDITDSLAKPLLLDASRRFPDKTLGFRGVVANTSERYLELNLAPDRIIQVKPLMVLLSSGSETNSDFINILHQVHIDNPSVLVRYPLSLLLNLWEVGGPTARNFLKVAVMVYEVGPRTVYPVDCLNGKRNNIDINDYHYKIVNARPAVLEVHLLDLSCLESWIQINGLAQTKPWLLMV